MFTAVRRADLASVLSSPCSYAVFATANDAFQALLNSNSSRNTLADVPQLLL
ncbi:hypothetical protein [uncultured Polaribacter sp.]|uniref:hypothetical protein n=1 Tax=uncultured Polaribacter sp. TaxID=174711 RepID=UPI0030DBEF0C